MKMTLAGEDSSLTGTRTGLRQVRSTSKSVFTSQVYSGSEICNNRGDPTGVYTQVVRYDSGIVRADSDFDTYLREELDKDLLKNTIPGRATPLDDDGSFSHLQTYRQGELEFAVSTWGAREYQSDAKSRRFYNVSVELRGPKEVIDAQRGSVDMLLQSVSTVYGLEKATSVEH